MAFDDSKVFFTKQTTNASGERVVQELNEQGFVLSEKPDKEPPAAAFAEDRVYLDSVVDGLALRGLGLDEVRDAIKRREDEYKAQARIEKKDAKNGTSDSSAA